MWSHCFKNLSFPSQVTSCIHCLRYPSEDVTAAIAPLNPSWRQTTFASFKSHSLPHTPLQKPSVNTSTRPCDVILPQPTSRTITKKNRFYWLRRYGRLPITQTFKGNRKRFELSGVRVIESSKKIAESMVKNSFYCTVNILITFNCRNVKWKLKDTSRL